MCLKEPSLHSASQAESLKKGMEQFRQARSDSSCASERKLVNFLTAEESDVAQRVRDVSPDIQSHVAF